MHDQDAEEPVITCPACNGSGTVYDVIAHVEDDCPRCGGMGEIEEDE